MVCERHPSGGDSCRGNGVVFALGICALSPELVGEVNVCWALRRRQWRICIGDGEISGG